MDEEVQGTVRRMDKGNERRREGRGGGAWEELIDRWMESDGWLAGCTDGRTDRQTDKQIHGQTDL